MSFVPAYLGAAVVAASVVGDLPARAARTAMGFLLVSYAVAVLWLAGSGAAPPTRAPAAPPAAAAPAPPLPSEWVWRLPTHSFDSMFRSG